MKTQRPPIYDTGSKLSVLLSIILLILSLSLTSGIVIAEKKITVFTPKVTDSYGKIFAEIIEGVNSVLPETNPIVYDINRTDFPINLFDSAPIVLSGRLNKKFVIASNTSVSNIDTTQYENRFVSGALEVPISSTDHYGVTLFFDPSQYIALALKLFPDTKKVSIFLDPEKGSISKDIRLELSKLFPSLTIDFIGSSHPKEAITAIDAAVENYGDLEILVFTRGYIELSTDLLLDYIADKTWRKKIPTIGNRIAFVKRGLTAGLSPNFYEMGKQIGVLRLVAQEEDFEDPRVEYLQASHWAVNLRSYRRAGGEMKILDLNQFKYVFKR